MRRPRRMTEARKKTKALKSRYRNLCTVKVDGKRRRSNAATPLKEWALATEDGKAWLDRKRSAA